MNKTLGIVLRTEKCGALPRFVRGYGDPQSPLVCDPGVWRVSGLRWPRGGTGACARFLSTR